MSNVLPAVEIEPAAGAATATVVWLHGLGANGHDFEPIVPELGLPPDAPVRFVFPHAPVRPVTINGGLEMPAWYDILGLGGQPRQDAQGIHESAEHVRALLARENARGVPTDRIVLAGFSQGGAIALHTGLRLPERLAGIMALSTYLPLADTLADERSDANRDVPIFMAHGRRDQVLPWGLGKDSAQHLERLDYAVEWHDYGMEHAVCPEEIEHIGEWLRRVLAL